MLEVIPPSSEDDGVAFVGFVFCIFASSCGVWHTNCSLLCRCFKWEKTLTKVADKMPSFSVSFQGDVLSSSTQLQIRPVCAFCTCFPRVCVDVAGFQVSFSHTCIISVGALSVLSPLSAHQTEDLDGCGLSAFSSRGPVIGGTWSGEWSLPCSRSRILKLMLLLAYV